MKLLRSLVQFSNFLPRALAKHSRSSTHFLPRDSEGLAGLAVTFFCRQTLSQFEEEGEGWYHRVEEEGWYHLVEEEGEGERGGTTAWRKGERGGPTVRRKRKRGRGLVPL